jgi:asparagine synthase (glutamine-hydrolysing)
LDGRVDNWKELRGKLLEQGTHLRTRADAELVLRAYERWGGDCLDHIDGDFAFVIWDMRRREAFCARDRMGARPFCYHWDGTRFSFASEVHAILALPWVRAELNEGMVAETLSYDEISRSDTLWKGVQRLVAANSVAVGHGGCRTRLYWSPELTPEIRYSRLDEYAEHYREIFRDSVRRHSRSHLGLACEVSGGLDSSSVFAAAHGLECDGRLLAPGIEGYSLHFDDGSRADEISYARAVGRHLGRDIRAVPPSLVPLSWYRDWANRYRDFPHYPNTVMGLSVREAIRDDGRRVVLTGYGGDEWQMGSRYYYADHLRDLDARGFISALRTDRRAWGLRMAGYWALRFGFFALLPRGLQATLKRWRRAGGTADQPHVFRLSDDLGALMRHRRRDLAGALPAFRAPRHELSLEVLLSATRAHTRESFDLLSSSVAVETRDPMTSTSMVEFHFATPDWIRQQGDEFRICHRMAMGKDLPDLVRDRDSKADFSSTIRRFVKDLPHFESALIRGCASRWLRCGEVERIVPLAAQPDSSVAVLWALWGLFGCALASASITSETTGT